MRKFIKIGLAAATSAFIAFAPATSQAAVLSSATPTYAVTWTYAAKDVNNVIYNLTGSASITGSGWNTNNLVFTITLTNGPLPVGLTNAGLTSFGFGIDPNVGTVTFGDANDGGMADAVKSTQQGSTQIPSVQGIEVCAFSGSNCSGGSQGSALAAGASDTFTISMTTSNGAAWGSSVTVDPIGFKYQTNIGSFEFSSSSGTPSTGSITSGSGAVPEPGTTALAGLAQGLLGLGFKRRNQAKG